MAEAEAEGVFAGFFRSDEAAPFDIVIVVRPPVRLFIELALAHRKRIAPAEIEVDRPIDPFKDRRLVRRNRFLVHHGHVIDVPGA